MMKEYQVTLISTTGKYKPVSCIIKRDSKEVLEIGRTAFIGQIQKQGIIKICQKRLWNNSDLKKYGYTKVKVREYDKEKIAKENAEKYEKLKEEKYASGEWQRPKERQA